VSSMQMLGGRYRLLNQLGRDGTSELWRGYDRVLDRTVAVTLLTGGATGAAARDVARAEAGAASRRSHPHTCQVYDRGESRTESGEPVAYLVTDLPSGPVPEEGRQPEPVADLCQLCLAEAISPPGSRAGEEPAGAAPAPPATVAAGTGRPQVRRHRRRPVLLVAIAVLATVAGVTGGIWMANRPSPDRFEAGMVAEPDPPPVDSLSRHPAGERSPLPDPSPDGAPTGPTRTEGAEPPDTPRSSASPETPGAVETLGGTVLARCVRSAAVVEALDLAPGFQVVAQTRGPGVVRAGIVLGSSDREVRVNVRCRADQPVSTVHTRTEDCRTCWRSDRSRLS